MEHFYKEVPSGWFNYEAIYRRAIEKATIDTPSLFVELGVWFGQSMCFAGVEIINSGKPIKLHGVDCFLCGDQPSPDAPFDAPRYSEVFRFIEPVKDVIEIVKADTHEASLNYENESIDFLFIDANHTYEGVMQDLVDWYPKVKKGGLVCGHDYQDAPWSGLVKAVDEFLGKENFEIDPNSWSFIHYKK